MNKASEEQYHVSLFLNEEAEVRRHREEGADLRTKEIEVFQEKRRDLQVLIYDALTLENEECYVWAQKH